MIDQIGRAQKRRRSLEVFGRRDDIPLRAHQESTDHGRVAQFSVAYGDVHHLSRQVVHAVSDPQGDRKAWMLIDVVPDPFAEELRARVRRCRNVDPSFHGTRVLAKHALTARPGGRHRVAGLHEALALGRQAQRASRALDEPHTEFLLDPLEPRAHGRGCLVQLPSGLAQRLGLRDAKEQAEVVQLHGPSF